MDRFSNVRTSLEAKPVASVEVGVLDKGQVICHGNQLPYLVRGPYQNLLHPT
jgi:hypothetical protein